ncbi:cell division protein FtsQ/DivIB [Patescibacteria group bacterium]
MKRRKKSKIFLYLKIVAFGLFISILFISPMLVQKLITIKEVECKSQYGDCPDGLIGQDLTNFNTQSLFSVKKQLTKSLRNNYLISDFSLQYQFPNKLLVNILLKKPIFSLKNDESDMFMQVGESGVVLSLENSSHLPTVYTKDSGYSVGETVNKSELFALRLIEGVFSMYQVRSGRLNVESLTVELPTSLRVIFPLEGDRNILLGALRLIYSKGENIKEIDLRYKDPVLR